MPTPDPAPNDATAPETRAILDSIRRLVQSLRVAARAAENQLGISGAQLFVLQKLDGQPPMSVNDLAARTCTHQSSVSVVVQRLVERGLVKRQPSADDRRRVDLSLTPAGKKLLAKSPATAQDQLIAALESMPPTARKQLATRLADLTSHLGLPADSPPTMLFEDDPRPRR